MARAGIAIAGRRYSYGSARVSRAWPCGIVKQSPSTRLKRLARRRELSNEYCRRNGVASHAPARGVFNTRPRSFTLIGADEDPDRILHQVAERCKGFGVRVIGADGAGNGHVYNRLLTDRLEQRCLLYAIMYSTSEQEPRQEGLLWRWTVNRSASIGTVFGRVQKKTLLFPKLPDCGSCRGRKADKVPVATVKGNGRREHVSLAPQPKPVGCRHTSHGPVAGHLPSICPILKVSAVGRGQQQCGICPMEARLRFCQRRAGVRPHMVDPSFLDVERQYLLGWHISFLGVIGQRIDGISGSIAVLSCEESGFEIIDALPHNSTPSFLNQPASPFSSAARASGSVSALSSSNTSPP